MENTTNGEATQGVDLAKMKKMFAKHQNPTNKKKPQAGDILKKFFTPRADTEIFRILPPLEGRDYIETAFFHVIRMQGAGGKTSYKKIFCPAHNNGKTPKLDANGQIIRDKQGAAVMIPHDCPLCNKSKDILRTQDPSLKGVKKDDMNPQQLAIKEKNDKIYKESNGFSAKKFYIIRGVDKGAEKDGVKFWRFKHDYRNQGILDKLGPAVTNFMEANDVDFSDINKGTDLKLTVVDAARPGGNGTYRYTSSIYPLGPSLLHADPIVLKEWTNDPITWREVFRENGAPNITTYQFLELAAEGKIPYWENSVATDKHWVFPGRPDLEEKANTRDANFDADNKEEKIEMASDLVNQSYDNVTIGNVTKEDVGTFKDNAVDVTAQIAADTPVEEPTETKNVEATVEAEAEEKYEDYDDLPF